MYKHSQYDIKKHDVFFAGLDNPNEINSGTGRYNSAPGLF